MYALLVAVASASWAPAALTTIGGRPAVAASAAAGRRPAVSAIAMAKKAFKGGNLDDFLSAGDAEAKYGPQRYAAVYDDLRKLEIKEQRDDRDREYSKRVYDALKKQLLYDHAFLSLLLTAAVWSFFDLTAVRSFVVGAALGAFYLVLSQRSADSFGAASVEEIKGGPPALIAPVLMVLLIAKNPGTFAFLPTFAGFSVERLATVAQVFYPSDFGLKREEDAGAVAGARADEE